jgi:hypothetical protein
MIIKWYLLFLDPLAIGTGYLGKAELRKNWSIDQIKSEDKVSGGFLNGGNVILGIKKVVILFPGIKVIQ